MGIMGKPMAKNPGKAGHQLVVSTQNSAAQELTADGASAADTPRDVAQVDLVITMLPNSPDVKAVALGPDGIIEGTHRGLIFVDMSSIAPLVAREVSKDWPPKASRCWTPPSAAGSPRPSTAPCRSWSAGIGRVRPGQGRPRGHGRLSRLRR